MGTFWEQKHNKLAVKNVVKQCKHTQSGAGVNYQIKFCASYPCGILRCLLRLLVIVCDAPDPIGSVNSPQ